MIRIILPLVLLTLWTLPARADDDCANATTTVAIQACQTEKLIGLQSDVDVRYKKRLDAAAAQDKAATAATDKRHLKLLKQSQTAFEAYTKAECQRQAYMYNGGTMTGIAAGTCLQTMASRRIEDMKVWPEPEE